ncbi:hypothetical protein ADL25_34155 [Streptomyces sp. NRRL F-5122]|uniref:hypothetical protein n=1 Tax=Streptomyces sp. NRRL F-5122 TaxID=1609098 RepID=UPI0007411FF5|nr:hypothetical protein [Streptomyces sp. NRRL F-5122]KUJ36169.1 hypothetical protein ADL25_34155 [Streptomyces sp. NRRL F-5122]
MGGTIRVGEILRYPVDKDPTVQTLDGYPNFYFATHTPGHRRALLEAGINAMAHVKTADGERRPAVLIRSSPWKAGTEQTPWHDVFDLDNGHVRYFGDHKAGLSGPPGSTRGNAALLDAFDGHQEPTPEAGPRRSRVASGLAQARDATLEHNGLKAGRRNSYRCLRHRRT